MKSNFRLARMRNGFTQKEAAKLLEISAVYLCRVENKDISVSDDVLHRMRKLYDDHTLTKTS